LLSEFATAYQRARATDVEDWLDDMIKITERDNLDPLAKRVRIDARRWITLKVAPQRYGDKVILGDGSIMGGSVALSDLSNEQLAALETLAAVRLPADPSPEPEAIDGVGSLPSLGGTPTADYLRLINTISSIGWWSLACRCPRPFIAERLALTSRRPVVLQPQPLGPAPHPPPQRHRASCHRRAPIRTRFSKGRGYRGR
jgi:hypothetical protein